MSKKKSKKIRKEQAQELSSAEPEHLKLAAEKTAAIASYIKDPDYRLRCKAAIDILRTEKAYCDQSDHQPDKKC